MTIRVGTDAQGHHSHSYRQSRTQGISPFATKPPEVRVGIERRGVGRAKPPPKPLSDTHLAILKMVDIEDPISAREIAEVLGMKANSVNSGLYVLQSRGLVQRSLHRKGWVKIPPTE